MTSIKKYTLLNTAIQKYYWNVYTPHFMSIHNMLYNTIINQQAGIMIVHMIVRNFIGWEHQIARKIGLVGTSWVTRSSPLLAQAAPLYRWALRGSIFLKFHVDVFKRVFVCCCSWVSWWSVINQLRIFKKLPISCIKQF